MGFTKRVALKKIRSHLVRDDPKFVQSMINEARIGGLLHHANIVDVLEFDQVGRHYYIAMEYVDGGTVTEIVRTCRKHQVSIPRFAILDLALQICRGLHHAHTLRDLSGNPLDLIHRDLKPSNVIVDRNGIAKICDFGIAKAASNLGHSTHSAVIKGTPRFMSPEQITGGSSLTPASDVFSLGAIFYELITGMTLFRAYSFHSLAFQIIEVSIGDAPRKVEVLFPGFGPIFERMVAKSPGDRYPDARSLADDLRGLAENNPPRADMTDVMTYLLPNLEHTGSRAIDGTGDLDEDSDMITQIWSADDSQADEADRTGQSTAQIWYSEEDLIEAEDERESDEIHDDSPFEPQSSDGANWERFSKAFQRLSLDSEDGSSAAAGDPALERSSNEITGPLEEPVSADGEPSERPTQPVEPTDSGASVVASPIVATHEEPVPASTGFEPVPSDATGGPTPRKSPTVAVLAALSGVLAIVLVLTLLPRLFQASGAPEGPDEGDGRTSMPISADRSAASVAAEGGGAGGVAQPGAEASSVEVLTDEASPATPSSDAAAEDASLGSSTAIVEPERRSGADPPATNPPVDSAVAEQASAPEPSTPSPIALTIELIEAPTNATAGFTKDFRVRVHSEDLLEGALQIHCENGDQRQFSLQNRGDGLWSASVVFMPEMVGRLEYYFWVQRDSAPESRVFLGSRAQPFSLQVF